jgi:hypothetical protein
MFVAPGIEAGVSGVIGIGTWGVRHASRTARGMAFVAAVLFEWPMTKLTHLVMSVSVEMTPPGPAAIA